TFLYARSLYHRSPSWTLLTLRLWFTPVTLYSLPFPLPLPLPDQTARPFPTYPSTTVPCTPFVIPCISLLTSPTFHHHHHHRFPRSHPRISQSLTITSTVRLSMTSST
ncbi:hypothetical protein FA13DRAFT_1735935, partial [Coprinellus micaceus]